MALSVYKKGQGTAARGVAAVVAVALAAWGAYQMYHTAYNWGGVAQTVATAMVAGLFGGVPLYLVLFNRYAAEILIETQQEMRKVAWSTRAEVLTSTVVIVITVVALSLFILAADFVMLSFERLIGLY